MPISLETPQPTIPTVKLLEKKQEIVGHICDMRAVPMTIYGTSGAPKLKPDGTQQTQDKVTLLVKQGTARVKDAARSTAEEDIYRQVQPGEEVVIWFQGHRRWDWMHAKREHGTINVGDVVRVIYIDDEPGKGTMPKKIWQIKLRAADQEKEHEIIARCEEIWRRLNQKQRLPPQEEEGWTEEGDPPW